MAVSDTKVMQKILTDLHEGSRYCSSVGLQKLLIRTLRARLRDSGSRYNVQVILQDLKQMRRDIENLEKELEKQKEE